MWYFSWILGTGLACSFAIMNAIWLEWSDREIAEEPSIRGQSCVPMPLHHEDGA